MGQHLLLLIPKFWDLLGQLPVHVVALALGYLGFDLVNVTNDLGFGGAVRGKQLFDGSGGKIDTGLGHDRVDHLACALEVRPAGCVMAQPGALDAVFVLLIALLAGFLVFLNELDVPQSNGTQRQTVHRVAIG